jgi:heterodisulfide reductase subunit A-like polyferredoxin
MKQQRATLPTPTSSNSFWHSEPNQFLLGHRTTEDLPAEADVVIVGSGITGTSAARYLSEDDRAKGKSVVLLEAREACWGATGRVSGSLLDSIITTNVPRMAATANLSSSIEAPTSLHSK